LFFSCKNSRENENAKTETKTVKENIKQEKKQKKIDTLFFTTECDTLHKNFLKVHRKRNPLQTFQNKTFLYCSPSLESQILDTLAFNTQLYSRQLIKKTFKPEKKKRNGKMVTIKKREQEWYEVNYKEKKGFLLKKGLTMQKLNNNVLFGDYLDHKQYNIQYPYVLKSYNSKDKNQVLDTFELYHNAGYHLKLLMYNGLEFNKSIIIYNDFRTSCPGTSSITYIGLDEKGKFSKIISSFNGTESTSTIFFPMKFGESKILLIKNANVNQIFNQQTGELNIYPYPSELNIPIEQLIVETTVEYAGDIEGLTESEIIIKSSNVNFYKWNGKKLEKIKTTGNNQ